MEHVTRYQGAIVRDGHILLVKQRFGSVYECWNVPGGGREGNESEEQCVIREMKEETNLDVRVERLLIHGPSHPHSPYRRFKTYLCTPIGGEAKPDGIESIEVGWFGLLVATKVDPGVINSETTTVMLQRIRKALGYA